MAGSSRAGAGCLLSDPSKTRYLFTGREFDTDTSLQYNRARWYDAEVGRWVSEDPLGFAAGDINTARYVGNQIVDMIDPTGLQPPRLGGGSTGTTLPQRWDSARVLPEPLGPIGLSQPPLRRELLDDFGLPTGIGNWSPGRFHRYSWITPDQTRYGCGGLFAMRAGLTPNVPTLWPDVAGAMVFITLDDALAHLKKLDGKGLIGAIETTGTPWQLPNHQPLPGPDDIRAGLPPQAFDRGDCRARQILQRFWERLPSGIGKRQQTPGQREGEYYTRSIPARH